MSRAQQTPAAADGSGPEDGPDRVTVDLGDTADRWRWRCPNGHIDWGPTNSHAWCRGCRRQVEAGEDVDPEHYELVDARTGERVPYSAIEVVDTRPPVFR